MALLCKHSHTLQINYNDSVNSHCSFSYKNFKNVTMIKKRELSEIKEDQKQLKPLVS